jgi:hypothetical protein
MQDTKINGEKRSSEEKLAIHGAKKIKLYRKYN